MTNNKSKSAMTPDELRPIIEAWGGVEKFARILDVSNRTVSYWLAGKHTIKPPIAKLIWQLQPPTTRKEI